MHMVIVTVTSSDQNKTFFILKTELLKYRPARYRLVKARSSAECNKVVGDIFGKIEFFQIF